MRRKLWLAAAVAACGLTLLASGAAAETIPSDMKLLHNGASLELAEQSYLVEHHLYAPYDAVARQLGAEGVWDADAQSVKLTLNGNSIEFRAGGEVFRNGLRDSSALPLQLIEGDAYVPVRLVYESFDYTLGYEESTRTVSLTERESAPGFTVFGVQPSGYVIGDKLEVSVFAFGHSLQDFSQHAEPKQGEGHIHLWLDSELTPQLAVKSFRSEPVVFDHLAPGEHTLTVQLVGNDHKPIEPEVKREITFSSARLSVLKDLDESSATGLRIEGVIANEKGHVFTVEMGSMKLYRIDATTGEMIELTTLPRSATGMAFDAEGNLYLASGGQEGVIFKVNAADLEGDPFEPARVETFASGTAGANGLTFDAQGNLYVSGGANGNIYKVAPDGTLSTYPSGIQPERSSQMNVVNGLAFGSDGKLYVANTSSGEVNRFTINGDGSLGEVELVAKDPLLYGADGLNFGPDGAVYVAANERNAIVRVTTDGKVTEVTQNGNEGPLEFPASLHFVGHTLFISNFDVTRGTNMPGEPGIGASVIKLEFGADQ